MKKQQTLFEDALPFASAEFKSSWEDWTKHREWMKEPLSPMAVKRQLKFLSFLSEADAIRSIDNSINNNWTGLFEPKKEQTENRQIVISQWDGKTYGQ